MNKKSFGFFIALISILAAANANASTIGFNSDGSTCSSDCVIYYNNTLNVTVLNTVVSGNWDAGGASSASVQYWAEYEGFRRTGLTGWVIPTQDQFGQLTSAVSWLINTSGYKPYYWSSTTFPPTGEIMRYNPVDGTWGRSWSNDSLKSLVIRQGNAANDLTPAPVPLPASVWMLFSGIAGLGLVRRSCKA